MDLVPVPHPNWYWFSILATIAYAFVSPPLVRRTADARVVASIPIFGNAVVTSYAVVITLRALSAIDYEPKNAAALVAAVAEASFPLFVGAIVSVSTSLLIALAPSLASARNRRTRLGSVALIVGAIGFAATTGFVWYLRSKAAAYHLGLERPAVLPFMLAALGSTFALAALFWRRKMTFVQPESPRLWFLALAALSALAARFLWIASSFDL